MSIILWTPEERQSILKVSPGEPADSNTTEYTMTAERWIKNMNNMAGTDMMGRVSRDGISFWGSREEVNRLRELVEENGGMSVTRFDDCDAREEQNMCIIRLSPLSA